MMPAPSAIEKRTRLFHIIAERSYSTGTDVELASGKTSKIYFDMKPTTMHPEGATLVGALLLDRLPDDVEFIGGYESGSIPLTTVIMAVAYTCDRDIHSFYVRKEPKKHGLHKRIEGAADGELTGKRVAILDDVTTSGQSAMRAVEECQQAGATVVAVIAVVDREEGAAELFGNVGIRFESLFRASQFTSK